MSLTQNDKIKLALTKIQGHDTQFKEVIDYIDIQNKRLNKLKSAFIMIGIGIIAGDLLFDYLAPLFTQYYAKGFGLNQVIMFWVGVVITILGMIL
jgi:hypothetical protein